MDYKKNDLIKIDKSVRIEDSIDRNHWKDLVDTAKHLQGV